MPDDQGSATPDATPDSGQTRPPGLDAMALLQALHSGDGDPAALLLSQLSPSGAGEPDLGLWLKLLQQQAAEEKDDDEDDQDPEALREEIRTEVLQQQEETLREALEGIKAASAEIDLQRRRIRRVAAGLGACPECLGDDVLCPTCDGDGIPGWRLPAAAPYRRVVLPAKACVDRFMRDRAAAARSTGPDGRETHQTEGDGDGRLLRN